MKKEIVMTANVADDKVAKFARQQHDWMERVLKGSLDPVEVAQAVQNIINRGQKLFNPHAYFKTREGLWVSDEFANRILTKQPTTMPYRGLEGVTSNNLARNMTDTEIIDELLDGMEEVRKHASTLDQIATMIDLQPKGIDGELLNNGDANIFYVLVGGVLFAVLVYWDSDNRKWNVHGWPLVKRGDWLAGCRVFRNMTLVIRIS